MSAKGGQGTSVTACAVALAAAGRGLRVRLDGEERDALEAILGMGPGGGVVLPGLVLGDANGHEFDLVFHDGPGEEGTTLLVTRGCYLALRQAVRQPVRPAGIVLVEEPGRALGATEVGEVIGAPVVARIPVRPAIARAVDAGVLAAHPLRRTGDRCRNHPRLRPLRGTRHSAGKSRFIPHPKRGKLRQ